MVAGLEEITAGEILIGGRRVNDDSPAARNIAMVFQNYALYPHMTVRKNMELALKIRGMSRQARAEQVERVARMLGLTELLERKPAKLSGGQRQRVAMGRAIVRDPSVFLLDEPLSNLDAKLRAQVRSEIAELQRTLRTTTIFVTHDQVEAMTMAHRVAVMRHGVLQQVGTPQELYERPANLFVADFIGSPAMNFLQGAVVEGDSGRALAYGRGRECRLDLPRDAPAQVAPGAEVIVGVRPEHLTLANGATPTPRLPGTVTFAEPLGGDTIVHVQIAAPAVVTDELREVMLDVDETALQELERADVNRFVMLLRSTQAPSSGAGVELALDASNLYFFDPASGRALR
jgi:multiple sugar transport system ATP-binding protein